MTTRRRRHTVLPQNVHVMPKGHSTTRLCGATTGAFVRERDAAWLKRFLTDGGTLCGKCEKLREATP